MLFTFIISLVAGIAATLYFSSLPAGFVSWLVVGCISIGLYVNETGDQNMLESIDDKNIKIRWLDTSQDMLTDAILNCGASKFMWWLAQLLDYRANRGIGPMM